MQIVVLAIVGTVARDDLPVLARCEPRIYQPTPRRVPPRDLDGPRERVAKNPVERLFSSVSPAIS